MLTGTVIGIGLISCAAVTPLRTDSSMTCHDLYVLGLRRLQQEPPDKAGPQPADEIAREEEPDADQDDQVSDALANICPQRVAVRKLPVAFQMIDRNTRPPSSGKPGSRLKTPSSRLAIPR